MQKEMKICLLQNAAWARSQLQGGIGSRREGRLGGGVPGKSPKEGRRATHLGYRTRLHQAKRLMAPCVATTKLPTRGWTTTKVHV